MLDMTRMRMVLRMMIMEIMMLMIYDDVKYDEDIEDNIDNDGNKRLWDYDGQDEHDGHYPSGDGDDGGVDDDDDLHDDDNDDEDDEDELNE